MPCSSCEQISVHFRSLEASLQEKEQALQSLTESVQKERLLFKAQVLWLRKLIARQQQQIDLNGENPPNGGSSGQSSPDVEFPHPPVLNMEAEQRRMSPTEPSVNGMESNDSANELYREQLAGEIERLTAEIRIKSGEVLNLQKKLCVREDHVRELIERCEEKDELLRSKTRANKMLLKQLSVLTCQEKLDKSVETDSCLYSAPNAVRRVDLCPPGHAVAWYKDGRNVDVECSSVATTELTETASVGWEKGESPVGTDGKTSVLNERLSGMLHVMETLQSRLAVFDSSCPEVKAKSDRNTKKCLKKVTFDLSKNSFRYDSSKMDDRVRYFPRFTLRIFGNLVNWSVYGKRGYSVNIIPPNSANDSVLQGVVPVSVEIQSTAPSIKRNMECNCIASFRILGRAARLSNHCATYQ